LLVSVLRVELNSEAMATKTIRPKRWGWWQIAALQASMEGWAYFWHGGQTGDDWLLVGKEKFRSTKFSFTLLASWLHWGRFEMASRQRSI